MNINELMDHELLAMVVLAKHMVHADGNVSKAEMLDLLSLGEAIGMDRFKLALDASENKYKDRKVVYNIAARVQRYDAKVLIYVLLEELAKGDGVDGAEKQLLTELAIGWQI